MSGQARMRMFFITPQRREKSAPGGGGRLTRSGLAKEGSNEEPDTKIE
jgi:hypothetical protein